MNTLQAREVGACHVFTGTVDNLSHLHNLARVALGPRRARGVERVVRSASRRRRMGCFVFQTRYLCRVHVLAQRECCRRERIAYR